jgi:uncharacterized membrane protein YkvA (DUF1232 family)
MTLNPPLTLPEPLNRHLSSQSSPDNPSVADYVNCGAALVTPPAVAALRSLLPPLHAKIAGVHNSDLFRRRLEVLVTYFQEASSMAPAIDDTTRDVTFALLYFLKGFDRIPDMVPEIGLLDDALVADFVLQQNSTALRAHWLRQGRRWPLNDRV